MARKVTLYTAQWGDMPLETLCEKASLFGYDGLELACTENHLDLARLSPAYCEEIKSTLARHGLELFAISNHTTGQCVTDRIDERHKAILPPRIWGDGDPEGVRQRAAQEMITAGEAARLLGVSTIIGFTGSPIWHLLYSFPPVAEATIQAGFREVADRFKPILDAYRRHNLRFALEVHPTEIAFDTASAQTLLQALDYDPAFGFNYDPSHLGYQGVDYVGFITSFAPQIFHVHMKDVWWSDRPTRAGVFGGHLGFGHRDRYWDFRSLGRGRINFEEIIRALNAIDYRGPLSVEWEDNGMDREAGAAESLKFVKQIDFPPSRIAFDAAFEK
ncbi:MAG: sugar phosphate isomerase/epimerase [Tannerella sp.]|jgi:sugar phosphate isomerase/epimerase|nr:sugar phosphate isomerase/epimerase [Tannerella sp.]